MVWFARLQIIYPVVESIAPYHEEDEARENVCRTCCTNKSLRVTFYCCICILIGKWASWSFCVCCLQKVSFAVDMHICSSMCLYNIYYFEVHNTFTVVPQTFAGLCMLTNNMIIL